MRSVKPVGWVDLNFRKGFPCAQAKTRESNDSYASSEHSAQTRASSASSAKSQASEAQLRSVLPEMMHDPACTWPRNKATASDANAEITVFLLKQFIDSFLSYERKRVFFSALTVEMIAKPLVGFKYKMYSQKNVARKRLPDDVRGLHRDFTAALRILDSH